MLTLGTVGMSFHGFTGHIDYTCEVHVHAHLCLLLAHALAARYFPHTKWPTVVSCTEAVISATEPFRKNPSIKLILPINMENIHT